ncbi:hypothetical protein OSB04_022832 [Centaurea solstitialis]|uniref:DUF1985 domain-containing protein n=1 Tax=Centaurea solstitialis TaxID=347529 RepID=A0AA38W8U6_9ASTR|nr:hypothetical protein OSB04_022832 [Centaurea solstitialis]
MTKIFNNKEVIRCYKQHDGKDENPLGEFQGDFIYPSLTLRCRMSLASDIRNALSDDRRALFRTTPFGDWLDVTMHRQIEVPNAEVEELFFDIGGHIRRFGREEFMLVTGLRFGPQPTIGAVHGDAFIRRVFPGSVIGAPRGQPLRLKISDVRARFHDMSGLSDEDAVRVCSVLMVEMAFLGHQPHHYVSDVVVRAVEDLDTWNGYPWGSLIWSATCKQMDGAFMRRVEPSLKMTMSGFLYAFKIWILEMFPISTTYFTKTNRYPRGIRWERSLVLSKAHCLEFFSFPNDGRHPRERLVAEPFEKERAWYRDSHAWFQSPESRRPPKKVRCLPVARNPSSPESGSSTDSSFDDDDGVGPPQHSPEPCHDHPGFGHGRDNLKTTNGNLRATPEPSYHVSHVMSYDMTSPSYITQPTSTQFVHYSEQNLIIRARISVAKDIFVKLRESDRRLALFRDTCFGPWLDIRSTDGDPMLIHLILQTQFFPEGSLADDMWFRIGGHELRLGPEEFCLITGFRFGPMDACSQEISGNPFRDRVFPKIPARRHVRGFDLRSVFNSKKFDRIPDLDAVRICLLLLLEVGFSGHQLPEVVSDFLLRLVEDLDAWNRYPWGSYLWALTHPQLKNALPRDRHHSIAQYTLTGFVFAFKVRVTPPSRDGKGRSLSNLYQPLTENNRAL